MSRHKFFYHPRLFVTATTAGMLLITSVFSGSASAQTVPDPVEFGAGQLPYVMILMDTSASMEWTDKGDAAYPELKPPVAGKINAWSQGTDLEIVNGHPTVESVGTCYVWRPQCDVYERPSWCADASCESLSGPVYSSRSMRDEIQKMRESSTMRLTPDNMPRHVMIKEILAGDMVLKSDQNSTETANRPGCWFVPRFKSAGLDDPICEGEEKFSQLVDADDPRPHIQEVYDYRQNNGLLERMSNTVLLGITMFDGYQYDGRGWGMNDLLAGDSPLKNNPALRPSESPANESEDLYQPPPNTTYNYDLGIYRVLGPTNLAIGLTETRAIARYAQDAIADAGYVSLKNDPAYVMKPDSDSQSFIQPYQLAKQPISGGTPLAAAMHDIYQYFLEGQYKAKETWEFEKKNKFEPDEVINPFSVDNDLHRTCRPKHVIILTDGYPEPEAPDGAGNGLGSENLASGFGYDINNYPYGLTEDVIKEFVNDPAIGVVPGDPRFGKYAPRVHIIGVNVADGVAGNTGPIEIENSKEVLTKLAVMAKNGNTCAQYYLPVELLPVGVKTGMPKLDAFGVLKEDGECDLNNPDSVCLQPQSNLLANGEFTSYRYYPDPTKADYFDCSHPALIFNRNDKSTIKNAFQAVFNEIISSAGMAARTRPSMTSYLDLPKNISGQYRMYAGVKMEGSSPFWKGLLNQESLQCTADGGLSAPPSGGSTLQAFRSLHDEISQLRISLSSASGSNPTVANTDVTQDRRRVFTMVPSPDWYNFTLDRGIAHPLASAARAVKLDSHDEFGESYVSSTSGPPNTEPIGTRIPFEHNTLRDAYLGNQRPFSGGNHEPFYSYLGIDDAADEILAEENLRKLIDEVRGRSANKFDRVLGGIFQSNPVTVGPPDLSVPIDSYRQFQTRHSKRPTMLYVGTLDGQLHAIYTGQPKVLHRQETLPDNAGLPGNDAAQATGFYQREAWSYIPHMLHGELQRNAGAQARLLDGTPVVSDVRLCNALPSENTNSHACVAKGATVPEAEQWRTVLVQGLGDAGRGYFALDVTRTGDETHAPDPIPLWEFNDKWEFGQLLGSDATRGLYGPNSSNSEPTDCQNVSQAGNISLKEWQLPYMGSSVGEAAIGTVTIDHKRRAVAVFSAGLSPESSVATDQFGKCKGADRIGRAIYVVDLQSGKMLRRFVDYSDGNQFKYFDTGIVGTPALFDGFPGSLVTRGFIGDSAGRLFRIDLSGGSPENWKVTEFFNPDGFSGPTNIDLTAYNGGTYGPAAFKPAIAMNKDRNLVIIYGLGSRGDTETNGQTQYIIALEEKAETVGATTKVVANPLWGERFGEQEKLTGEPVIFNGGVYFTTYYKQPDMDACEPGFARIYGLSFTPENNKSVGVWPVDAVNDDTELYKYDEIIIDGKRKWFGPADPTLIRGVAITMGASCSDAFDEDGNKKPFNESAPRIPQLIAQTGSAAGNNPAGSTGGGGASGAGSETINTITKDLAEIHSQSIPLSWTVITN